MLIYCKLIIKLACADASTMKAIFVHRLPSIGRLLLLASLWCCLLPWARSQDAVSFLKAERVAEKPRLVRTSDANVQAFTFNRNLIFFPAIIDGKPGKFILDTGAPSLLLNNRGTGGTAALSTGLAAGGEVALTNQRVESFEMGGKDHGRRWALALDLRSMETRMESTIDGFVGHDLLRSGELRIDYPARTFQLRKSTRFSRHNGKAPTTVLPFDYVDHLPVITVRVGKRKLRFAIDTGAGANLIDARHAALFRTSGDKMNIQGLDGGAADYDIVTFSETTSLDRTDHVSRFVSLNLDHLQSPGEPSIDGLLGSAFLSNYCVGIDYRRRKIYLW